MDVFHKLQQNSIKIQSFIKNENIYYILVEKPTPFNISHLVAMIQDLGYNVREVNPTYTICVSIKFAREEVTEEYMIIAKHSKFVGMDTD
jgi:hypothetical protein